MKERTHSILFMLFFLLASCVGTVEETVPPSSLKLENPPTTFNFPGIVTARAISHNKVELEFFPASGGADITYQLYVNNSSLPITVDPKALLSINGGKLLYTVDDLLADREYQFKLTAHNIRTNAISQNENETYARTFDNVVADFNGVSKLSLVPGNTSGAIRVDWIAPAMSGVFSAGPFDPVHYEVTVISEIGGVANLNNPTYNGTDKKMVLVPTPPSRANPLNNPQTINIDGLAAGRRYYVQVRAINTLYQNYDEDPAVSVIPVSREINTKAISIVTEQGGTLFDFRQDNVVLANAPSIDAFDKIDIFWQAGTGSFTGYRIFVRKYDGTGDPEADDKLTEAVLHGMNTTMDYKEMDPTDTTYRKSGLELYSHYQVKVALCKTTSCPVQATDPNAAIISDLKTIQVVPTLAPFSGINNVEPPGQYSERDMVKLRFDAPLIGSGYANIVEFYCVDPADHSNMALMQEGIPLAGSSISRCNGLYLDGTAPAISTYTSQKVKGMMTDGSTEYCFAATPAISGIGGVDIRLNVGERIVRCSFPEVRPPSIAQFPGLNDSCSISGVDASVSWNLPTGGIYSGFKVFWKEKSSAAKFSFANAIGGSSGYSSSLDLTANTQDFTVNNLIPGKSYQMGVLAVVDMDPYDDLYSEYNLKIVECNVPLPIPTFKGFTRIFAVGPKMDGRIPNDSTKMPAITGANNSLIYEALDSKGIPYEVAMDSANSPNTTLNFTAPPGRDYGVSFTGAFDGISETTFNYAMSRQGIVSLGWQDVQMDYAAADSIFTSNQPAAPASRSDRKWGYKVYRSSDNKLTWVDLTQQNGPVYSEDFTYYKRANVTATIQRMAFFTDYSVKAMYETHNATTGQDIERARTYYYKIVPIFDGKELTYDSGKHHIVQVTLPPPNMALVHRWMANRARCLELGKEPVIGNNYNCSYNGIGAKPQSIPHQVGQTALDQGGDLLVDRQELGCRYTRGAKTANPEVEVSMFKLPDGTIRPSSNDDNHFPMFRGWRTAGGIEDTTTAFRGCTGEDLSNLGNQLDSDYPAGFVAEYQRYLQGDCTGPHLQRLAYDVCTSDQFLEGSYASYYISTPGVSNYNTTPYDCSASNPTNPSTITERLLSTWAPNAIMQSEFLAVFYNSNPAGLTSSDKHVPIQGPSTASLTASRELNRSWANEPGSASCSINLASIGSDGFMKPRWLSINELSLENIRFKGAYPNLLNKTVNEITEVATTTNEADLTFYNGTAGDGNNAAFTLPETTLRSSNRFRNTTRIAKILASNSAKLPPIGRLSSSVAEALCESFFVQPGIANDSGSFVATAPVQSKRSLRRIESIAASAWSETYNTAAIQNIEASTSAGSCVNAIKDVNEYMPVKGGLLRNHMTVGGRPMMDIPLITGSSRYNGLASYTEPFHSANCISRYGIQDMVGNVSEDNSERIFCDYTKDKIHLGPVSGTWGGGLSAQNTGAGGPDYDFFNTNEQKYNWSVLRSGDVTGLGSTGFEIRFRDGSPAVTDAKPWVEVSTDSGYCSFVDNLPARRSGDGNVFRDVSTNIWSPLFLPGGVINNGIVNKQQADQESVLTWRNGDGRFMDFGPQGLGPALKEKDSLALSGVTALSKYFNPVVGLPLKCNLNGGASSCNDSSLSNPNDNTSVTIASLEANIVPETDDIPAINNFPIGNSAITNPGVADYTFDALGYTQTTVPISGGYSSAHNGPILIAVEVDNPTTMGNPVEITRTFPQDFVPGSQAQYYRVIWDLERGTDLGLISGGGSNQSTTGRFTASLSKVSVGDSPLGTGSHEFTRGTRCAVMINQD
ncbi:MAG: fibronectin type III domain-containing protein [Bacteriovoracaceae bacterium]|nr:fibronectin type III domain-containing protein [Bacteriovoracaceae bacterium]